MYDHRLPPLPLALALSPSLYACRPEVGAPSLKEELQDVYDVNLVAPTHYQAWLQRKVGACRAWLLCRDDGKGEDKGARRGAHGRCVEQQLRMRGREGSMLHR